MEFQTPTPPFRANAPDPAPVPPQTPVPAPPNKSYSFERQQQQQQQQQEQQQQRFERPAPAPSPFFIGTDIRSIKTACEASLREYAALQRQNSSSLGGGLGGNNDVDRLRARGGLAASDLRALRAQVTELVRKAEAGRWRKWLVGGFIAAIIPAVRKIFRRSSDDDDRISSNDTEHAFRKSKSLTARILDSVHGGRGRSGFASIAFFVLAVLYVFQSEVSFRLAKTVSKRLKTLVAKVENGVEEVNEQDLKVLNGWRWRVLLW